MSLTERMTALDTERAEALRRGDRAASEACKAAQIQQMDEIDAVLGIDTRGAASWF